MPRKSTSSAPTTAAPATPVDVVATPAPKAPKEPKAPKASKALKEEPKVQVVPEVVATEDVKVKRSSKKAPKSEAVEAAETIKVEVVADAKVVVADVVETEAVKDDKPGYRGHKFTEGDLQMDAKFDELTKQISSLLGVISSMESSCRTLQKEVRDCRRTTYRRRNELLLNQCKPRKNKSGNNSFVTVSDKLSSLLGYAANEVVSRSQVRADLTKYIKSNKLEKEDGRFWNYSPALEDVFGIVDNFGYFAMAKALSPHLVKASAPTPAAVVV